MESQTESDGIELKQSNLMQRRRKGKAKIKEHANQFLYNEVKESSAIETEENRKNKIQDNLTGTLIMRRKPCLGK